MEQKYDVIACGTGFKECLLSGLLSVAGKKVLHVDRNNFYGGECASLNITQFMEQMEPKGEKQDLGPNRDWNIDLIPKFIMADGKLVKALVHTKVNESLNFQLIGGSYVYKDEKVEKVPSTGAEALATKLVGFFEKRCLKNFLQFVADYSKDPSKYPKVNNQTAKECMLDFRLEDATMTFIGHAMALEPDDSYLTRPAVELLKKLELYANSISKFQNQNSPYLYPMYGLGDLPQAFARLCAIWGGVYMLSKPVDEILMENGKAAGIRSGTEKAYAPIIIGDPSYFKDIPKKTAVKGRIVRAICLLHHPPSKMPADLESANIILPQTEVKRSHDIYVCYVSYAQRVCPKGWYIAIASTSVETDNPEAELKPALDLFGKIDFISVKVHDIIEPQIPGKEDGLYCSSSYDPTTHFETTIEEVLQLYEQIMGAPLDLDKKEEPK
jgi:Rab GDP dissociation inhibitor